jgi:hypothetical protein
MEVMSRGEENRGEGKRGEERKQYMRGDRGTHKRRGERRKRQDAIEGIRLSSDSEIRSLQ